MHKLTCPQRNNPYASCVCAAIEQREHTEALREYNENLLRQNTENRLVCPCAEMDIQHLAMGGNGGHAQAV